jgi:hypothetical protein
MDIIPVFSNAVVTLATKPSDITYNQIRLGSYFDPIKQCRNPT